MRKKCLSTTVKCKVGVGVAESGWRFSSHSGELGCLEAKSDSLVILFYFFLNEMSFGPFGLAQVEV